MTHVHNTLQNENYQISKMSIFYLGKLLKGGYITRELYTINTIGKRSQSKPPVHTIMLN